MAPKEIPVYLFLGFLEAGKTTFIQETMEDERFDSGERTLLLVCEEGVEEYDPSRFAVEHFAVEEVDEEGLNGKNLAALVQKHRADRVVLEYNGMWELQKLFDMRQLVYDKIPYADMVVFNRFDDKFSKEEFHKIVRGASRRPGIVFEYPGGRAEYDEIEDPLPYDINAKVIEIEDRDYAFFYRDLMEEMGKYDGKVVSFKGLVAVDRKMKQGTIVIGRHIMTCCEADIAYSGMVVKHASTLPLKTRDWVKITARIDIEYDKIYGQEGPVLKASALDYCEPPVEELATFY